MAIPLLPARAEPKNEVTYPLYISQKCANLRLSDGRRWTAMVRAR